MNNLTIEITDKCPFSCWHCSTYAAWDREDIEITPYEFAKNIDQYPDRQEVIISGGEPFMHPQIISLLEIAKRKGRKTTILSCGINRSAFQCYQPVPQELLRKDLIDAISFSLHGSPITHETVVNSLGIFPFIDETINRTISSRIPFSFGFVPLKINQHDLEGAVVYAAQKSKQQAYCQPDLHILRYVKQGSSQYICDIPDIQKRLALTPEENAHIVEQAPILQAKYGIHVVLTCSMREANCTAGTRKKGISVYGEVYDCPALKWTQPGEKSRHGEVRCKSRH